MTDAAPADALASAALAMARRFQRGATLWSWSPSWPAHAEHVAVEFVHPVIVGKRALPAFAVGAAGAAGAAHRLRRSARVGDVLVVIGPGDQADLVDVVTRSPAWGLVAVWLAHGEQPPVDTPARVVWLGDEARYADVVCGYHLLWELAHVCFEHPGLLESSADDAPSCPACRDVGDIGEVESVDGGADATVLVAGVRKLVDLSLVGPCEPAELVVVHAGVAIGKLVPAGPTGTGHG